MHMYVCTYIHEFVSLTFTIQTLCTYIHEYYRVVLLYVGCRFNVISMIGKMWCGKVRSTGQVVFLC